MGFFAKVAGNKKEALIVMSFLGYQVVLFCDKADHRGNCQNIVATVDGSNDNSLLALLELYFKGLGCSFRV